MTEVMYVCRVHNQYVTVCTATSRATCLAIFQHWIHNLLPYCVERVLFVLVILCLCPGKSTRSRRERRRRSEDASDAG